MSNTDWLKLTLIQLLSKKVNFFLRGSSSSSKKYLMHFKLFFSSLIKNKNMASLYDFKVKNIKGEEWDLAELKGKVK